MSLDFVPATGWRVLHPWYDWLATIFACEEEITAKFLADLELKTGETLLDVGCGTGNLLAALLHRSKTDCLGQIECCGVDIDPRMLDWSRRKLSQLGGRVQTGGAAGSEPMEVSSEDSEFSVRLVQANCVNLPFDADVFTAISCGRMFHHLTTQQKLATLKEMRRVSQRNGRLLLLDYGQPASRWSRIKFLVVQVLDGVKTTRANVRGELPALLSQAGWSDIREVLQRETLLGTLRCYRAEAGK